MEKVLSTDDFNDDIKNNIFVLNENRHVILMPVTFLLFALCAHGLGPPFAT
jgi:hypothetical protein